MANAGKSHLFLIKSGSGEHQTPEIGCPRSPLLLASGILTNSTRTEAWLKSMRCVACSDWLRLQLARLQKLAPYSFSADLKKGPLARPFGLWEQRGTPPGRSLRRPCPTLLWLVLYRVRSHCSLCSVQGWSHPSETDFSKRPVFLRFYRHTKSSDQI